MKNTPQKRMEGYMINSVIILPMTNKLRQKVKQYGEVWRVLERRMFVTCLGNSGVLVAPYDGLPLNISHPQIRWVRCKETEQNLNEPDSLIVEG